MKVPVRKKQYVPVQMGCMWEFTVYKSIYTYVHLNLYMYTCVKVNKNTGFTYMHIHVYIHIYVYIGYIHLGISQNGGFLKTDLISNNFKHPYFEKDPYAYATPTPS